jgi:hypothetical protein
LLRWNEVEYATEYKIYLVEGDQKELVATTDRVSYNLRDMSEGNYTFEVQSFNERLGESEGARLEFELIHPDMQSPEGLNALIRNGNDILLRWDESEFVTEYKVYQIKSGEKELVTATDRTNFLLRDMPEGDYTFEVTSYSDRFGESEEPSRLELELIHPDMQSPENLTALIRNGNDILLRWDESEFVTGYKVYQVKDGQKELVTTTDKTSFLLRDMPEEDYVFEVTSYSDRFGESEEPSRLELELIHPDMQSPENLTALIRNGNDILLRWDESEFVTEYKVYHVKDGQKELVTTTDKTSFLLRDMPEGDYEFEVTSNSDRFGESEQPSHLELNLTHSTMQAPEGLTALIRNGNDILIRWNEAEYATEYNVYQLNDGQAVLIASTDRTSLNLRDMEEKDYTFMVTSYSDRFGESKESSLEVKLIHPNMQSPDGFNALIRNGNDILLRWDESEFVTEYKLYQVVDGQKELVKTTDRTSFLLRDMPEGEYVFELSSYSDRFGESEQTSQLEVNLAYPEMEAPKGLTALIRNENDILLRWDETEFATRYDIYQQIDGEDILINSTDKTSLLVRDMDEGEYTFKVKSYSDRFGESANYNEAQVEVEFPEVEAPEIRISAEEDNDRRISWKAISNISSYNVYEIVNGEAVLLGSTDRVFEWVRDIEDGTHNYVVTAVHDRFGESNQSNVVAVEIISDITPPETTSNILEEWVNEDFNVELTVTDDKSGVAATYYSVNGSDFNEGTTFIVSEEGVNEISYYSVDKAGNEEEVKTETVKVDKTAPETISNITGEWVNEDYVVELTATDSKSGVATTYYSVNGSDYKEGTTFTVTEEGVNEVSYYSVDNAGNEEEVKTETVKVDKTAPETVSNITDEWVNEDFTVELTATDNKSGVAATYYSVNGDEFEEGTTFTVTEEGVNKVSYYSVDNAGNVEEAKVEYVRVDKTAPETISNITGEWVKDDYTVELTASDSKSGLAATYYSINGSEYEEGTTFTVTEEGVNEIAYYSVDNVGNVEESSLEKVKIDKTLPEVTLELNEEYALGTELQLLYEAEDSISGIATETLTFDETMTINGEVVVLEQPGTYTINLVVEDHAGWVTTVEKTITVYIPVELTVKPEVIKENKGKFTVQISFTKEFEEDHNKKYIKNLLKQFKLETATLNGVAAINETNGDQKKAEIGHFKFNREDFVWDEGETLLEFRGMVGDHLVKGKKIIESRTKKSKK